MEYYFSLQYTRLKRWSEEIGVNPILGITISLFLFLFISKLLFLRTDLAKWIYPLLAISILINMSNKEHNRQLKIIYNQKKHNIIRIIENGIVALPFLLYLLYEKEFIMVLILSFAAILLAIISISNNFQRTIPTPFSKWPFESIIGFRKLFLLFGLLYFLIFKAIQVGNYNLGMVSYGALYFVFMAGYFKPEPKYFVWIFNDIPNGFFKRKIRDVFICSSILTIPALISLIFFLPQNFMIPIAISLVGFIFLISMIFAKYSAYPREMNLPQGILFALSLWFPPMLLFVIPLFYKRSKQNVAPILE